MGDLVPQILALPRSEKLQLIALLALELQKEEPDALHVPSWQVELARKALEEIQSNQVQTIDHGSFWAAVDAKLEQLEGLK